MAGLAWKTAMAPIGRAPCAAKPGPKGAPPLPVFQMPPPAPPTKRTLGSDSTPSTVATRPLVPAGPIERAARPARRAGSIAESAARPGTESRRARMMSSAGRGMGRSPFRSGSRAVYHYSDTACDQEPASDDEEWPPAMLPPRRNPTTMPELILIVDDEPGILSTLGGILSDEGYSTLTTTSGE